MSSVSNVSYIARPEGALSQWNFSLGKRVFDAGCAALGLVAALPLMAAVAVAIRVSMPGPIMFRQLRVGRDAQPFSIFKFRTMLMPKPGRVLSVTRRGDSRITPLGRILRRLKLDELPQLFNVLRGDMSLVGPRPDVPEFIAMLSPEYRPILALRPGVTGWATLHFRDEEGILAAVPEGELSSHYVNSVLPAKARLDLGYAKSASFLGDLRIVLQTVIGTHSKLKTDLIPAVLLPDSGSSKPRPCDHRSE